MIGGHAQTVVGWDDDRKLIEVANSWGTSFGDGGFDWIPYEVIEGGDFSDFVAVSG